MERTVVIIKPDAVVRGLIGDLTGRFERKGLVLVGCKMVFLDDTILQQHYAHLVDRPYFPRIAAFMKSYPVLVQCWEGVSAVNVVRKLVGITNGRDAEPGTIRGDYSLSVQCNLVHASDSVEGATTEIARFFLSTELTSFEPPLRAVTYSHDEINPR